MAAKRTCKCVTVIPPQGKKYKYRRQLCWADATKKRAGGIVSNKSCK
jgi:hypothetical protein